MSKKILRKNSNLNVLKKVVAVFVLFTDEYILENLSFKNKTKNAKHWLLIFPQKKVIKFLSSSWVC